jgi:hypothetical protein
MKDWKDELFDKIKDKNEFNTFMKTNYDKVCKCGTTFVPYKTTDRLCYVCTKTKLALKNLEKIKKEKVKKQKEDLLTLQDYLKLAQQVFNKWIRLRDEGLVCISCQKPPRKKNAGHFYSQGGHSNVRFDEMNVHLQCEHCNSFLSGNLIEYGNNLIERIGKDEFELLRNRAYETRKWTKDELKKLISEYKLKIKEHESNT